MTIPSIGAIRKSLLVHLADEKVHEVAEVINQMGVNFKLTDMERLDLTSGNSKFNRQIRWAVSTLCKSLLLENVENKHYKLKITQTGLETMRSEPQSISDIFLRQFSAYREWKQSISNKEKIDKETTKKLPYRKSGLVSYIDMLGTRESQTTHSQQNISIKWNMLVERFEKHLKRTIKDANIITFNSFSDTIIITLEHKDPRYLLKKFAMAAWHIIPESIKEDIPVRGCFSIGDFFYKENFFIGTAITEAAQYYEAPQWIGITASPSAHIKIEKLSKKDPSILTYYHKYPLPLKHSFEQEAWAIKWPELYDAANLAQNKSSNMLNIIDKKLENATDVGIALKWRNTKKFYMDVFAGYLYNDEFTVSLDRSIYPLGSKIYVQANIPHIEDGIPIKFEIFNSKEKLLDGKTIYAGSKYSTQSDLGIYKVDFKMDGNDWKNRESYIIRVTYENKSEENSITVAQRTPVIQTDKGVYMIGSNMIVSVIDPDSDKDGDTIEYVGDRKESHITIKSGHGSIDGYRLKETGNSTGIFQGVIGILGMRRDGTVAPYNIGTEIIKKTQGIGDKDGYIAARPRDKITLTYYNGSKTVSLFCFISEFIPTVELDKKIYKPNDKMEISIIDPDHNYGIQNNEKEQRVITVDVKIGSNSINACQLLEIGPGVGVFTREVSLKECTDGQFNLQGEGHSPDAMPCCCDRDTIKVTYTSFLGDTSTAKASIQA